MMRLRSKSRRKIARLERLLQSKIELRSNGRAILGPMTLENLATIIRFGGYRPGQDIIGAIDGNPQLLVSPPQET